jgi:hypothetical protein
LLPSKCSESNFIAIFWWWFMQSLCAIRVLQSMRFSCKAENTGLRTAIQSSPELQTFLD